MTRKEQIKRLKEYKYYVLSLINKQEENKNEKNKQKEKQKVLVLTKNFYGRNLKVGFENN